MMNEGRGVRGGDAADGGGGIVSEEWLLSLLQELASLLDAPPSTGRTKEAGDTANVGAEIEDTPLQRCLCAVWDVTCVPEVRGLLLQHGAVELLAACVARHSGPQGDRTSEVVAGILGNLASGLDAARSLASNQPALVLCFLLLHVSDAPTLVELGRLFQGLLAHAHRDERVRTGLMPHITREAFYDRVQQLVCLDETQVCCTWMPVLMHMMYLGAWPPSTTMKLILSALSCEVVRVSRRAATETWADDANDAGGDGDRETGRPSPARSAQQTTATAGTRTTRQTCALERTALASSCINTLAQVLEHSREEAEAEAGTDTLGAPGVSSAGRETGDMHTETVKVEDLEAAESGAEDQEGLDTTAQADSDRHQNEHEAANHKESWQDLAQMSTSKDLILLLRLFEGRGSTDADDPLISVLQALEHPA